MKFNQFTKSQQLLAYMYYNEIVVRVKDDWKKLVSCGITSSAKALSSMLSYLKAAGYVENDVNGQWDLTCEGYKKAYAVVAALDADEEVPSCYDDEDDQPSDFDDGSANDQHIANAQKFVDEAKHWSDLAAQYATNIKNDNDSLQEINDLRAENEALKQEIDELKNENIRNLAVNNSLSSANAALHKKILELEKTINDRREYQLKLCDQLAAERKERERLERKLARIAAECKNMANWANDMNLN